METSHPYPSRDSTYLLGICTGSFPAVAVSASKSLSELIPAGIEASLVAFRTATLSLQCQVDHFRGTDTQERIWSAIVNAKEVDAAKLIQRFCEEKVTILHPILGIELMS